MNTAYKQVYTLPALRGTTVTHGNVAPTVPGTVTNLGAAPNLRSVLLSWSAPASSGSSPVTTYAVGYRVSGNGAYTAFSHTASTATNLLVNGLNQAVSYDFQVQAVSAAGTGPAATVLRVTTTASAENNLAFVGDSLTAQGYFLELRAKLQPLGNWFFHNNPDGSQGFSAAVGGKTTAQMLAEQDVSAAYDPARRNVLSIWGGRNDNTQEVTTDSFVATLSQLHAKHQADGWLTAAYTVTPSQYQGLDQGNLNMAQHEALRQDYNTWIRAHWNVPTSQGGLGATWLVDVGGDPLLGAYNAVLDSTYYNTDPTDRTHTNSAGQQRVADLFIAKVVAPPGNSLTLLNAGETATNKQADYVSFQGDWQPIDSASYRSGSAKYLDQNASKLGVATAQIATNGFRIPWNTALNTATGQNWYSDGQLLALHPSPGESQTNPVNMDSPDLGPGPHTITTGRGSGADFVIFDQLTAITI